ncbi:MAG TPA: phage antirepressor N-terminal domain-containing protein, partial [Ktedonobacteraceae bacterium]
MRTSPTLIIPARQAMVRIAGYEVLSICTANGSVAAGVRMICDLLGVARPPQMHKLQVDPDFRDSLILARVEIAGKQRVAYFIIAEFIPLWLKGIHPSKVAPEARETLQEFRNVAVQTLRAFFFPEAKAQQQSAPPKDEPEQSTLPPPEPEPFPPLGDEARYAYQDHMYLAHDGLERHLRAIDARLLTLTRQMAEVRQVLNQHAAILNEHLEALIQHKEALEQHREELRALATRVTNL